MRGKCRAFVKLQARFQPTCSHRECWGEWFDANKGKYHAARRALDEMGEDTVAQGQRIMLNREFGDERPREVNVFVEQQVGRFVKALKYRVHQDQKEKS